MAKSEIANLNVQLTANTNQFTAGMANAQRRLEQTTAVVTKSRAAFSGLGSAMRMPGLGRGAALGGAASGLLGAFGIGALGGGVGGVAAAGVYAVVDGLTSHYKQLNAQIEERRKKEQEITDTLLAQTRAISDIAGQLSVIGQGPAAASEHARRTSAFSVYEQRRAALEAQIATLRTEQAGLAGAGLSPGAAREVAARNRPALDAIRKQIAEAERLLEAAGRAYFNQANGRTNGMRTRNDTAAEANAEAEASRIAREGALGDRLTTAIFANRDRDRGSVADVFNALANAQRADEETARAIRDAVADWKRENQKASDLLATTVGRISSQITQLTYRSN